MYTSDPKKRPAQVMLKSTINSRKPLNLQMPTVVDSKMLNRENGFTLPIQINNPNLSKSKFTILRNPKDPTAASNAKQKTITRRENKKSETSEKSNIPVISRTKSKPVSKVLMTSLNKRVDKRNIKQLPVPQEIVFDEPFKENAREITEMAIQTNEHEILNHALIVGDLKIVVPSKSITDEIDKLRKEIEIKNLLKATRKFEEHSLRDEQHLDDLKEFLDKNYVTRKPHKFGDNGLEEDRRIIDSMDELLKRERPKTESITDIRSRIKHKEQELLSLFDHFQKKTELFANINV
ncbi:LOW QUALITY PROTEIN: uncharacterized protein LOC119604479 [Lucilia sericata]|uniref:LOW QUALITY PROTEIN: uncharacterized protein LOC119604479 n=1 Tax=Lucilia sericata TaxID=13632 RepID=UPI0018A82966|nr:LOW QUALITY PROTEIN: uncharacterized protein LOC119604479 [Lucilia sericata]